MKLPLAFVENMKSLTMRVAFPTNHARDPQFWIPVLGQWASDVLHPDEYQFYVYGTEDDVTYPTFGTAEFKKLRPTKAGDEVLSVAEVPITLWDGTVGNEVVFINDSERLNFLAGQWNTWLNQFASCSMATTTVSKDLGVNICTSVCGTSHWSPALATSFRRNEDLRLEETRFVRHNTLKRRKAAGVAMRNPYTIREQYAYSYSGPLVSGADEILQQWIQPTNWLYEDINPGNSTGFVKLQCMNGENFSSVRSATGNGGLDLQAMHWSYAAHMTKQVNAPPDNWELFFVEMSKKGSGGILSSLASAFGSAIGGPELGAVAGSIVGSIPGLGSI